MTTYFASFSIMFLLFLGSPEGVREGHGGAIPHQIDSTEVSVDITPPTVPVVNLNGIRRGRGPRKPRLPRPIIPPNPMGFISLTLWGAHDDVTDDDALSYRIYIIDGVPPEGLVVESSVFRAEPMKYSEYRIKLMWNDGGTDYQEPFGFTLAVSAIDLGGNESELSNVVMVTHGGTYGPPKHPKR